MITRYASSLLILGLVAVAPRLSAAMDADTARMEAANLCTAMPYTCGAVAPPVAAPVERKAPKLPKVHQKPVVVAQKPTVVAQETPVKALPTPDPTPQRALTHAEAATMEACAREVLRGATVVTMQHIHDIDVCVLLVSKALP